MQGYCKVPFSLFVFGISSVKLSIAYCALVGFNNFIRYCWQWKLRVSCLTYIKQPPSVHPPICPDHSCLVFSKFWHGARSPYEVVRGRAEFSRKIFPQKWENGPKIGFSEFLKNLVINFYWIYSIMKMYIICCYSCTNHIFRKIFVPQIWAKMFSANQIVGFFNQPYLQNKSMKLHVACFAFWYKFT